MKHWLFNILPWVSAETRDLKADTHEPMSQPILFFSISKCQIKCAVTILLFLLPLQGREKPTSTPAPLWAAALDLQGASLRSTVLFLLLRLSTDVLGRTRRPQGRLTLWIWPKPLFHSGNCHNVTGTFRGTLLVQIGVCLLFRKGRAGGVVLFQQLMNFEGWPCWALIWEQSKEDKLSPFSLNWGDNINI